MFAGIAKQNKIHSTYISSVVTMANPLQNNLYLQHICFSMFTKAQHGDQTTLEKSSPPLVCGGAISYDETKPCDWRNLYTFPFLLPFQSLQKVLQTQIRKYILCPHLRRRESINILFRFQDSLDLTRIKLPEEVGAGFLYSIDLCTAKSCIP